MRSEAMQTRSNFVPRRRQLLQRLQVASLQMQTRFLRQRKSLRRSVLLADISSDIRTVLLYEFWLVENQLQTTPTSCLGPT